MGHGRLSYATHSAWAHAHTGSDALCPHLTGAAHPTDSDQYWFTTAPYHLFGRPCPSPESARPRSDSSLGHPRCGLRGPAGQVPPGNEHLSKQDAYTVLHCATRSRSHGCHSSSSVAWPCRTRPGLQTITESDPIPDRTNTRKSKSLTRSTPERSSGGLPGFSCPPR